MEGHRIDIEAIARELNQAINELPSSHQDWHIHRVSEGLRRAKPEAYEPIIVSIGPYHLKNPKLQAMKIHKLWYLRSLLARREENMQMYIAEMETMEDRVRNYYVESIDDDLSSEKFVQMMLLDACFIVEFFRQKAQNHRTTILNVDCVEGQIFRDFMLLENQLPFFLLSNFYDRTRDPDEDPFLEIAMSIFTIFMPMPYLNSRREFPTIKHLLHLVYVLCLRPLPKQTASLTSKGFAIDDQMHSAVELEEAGVKFRKVIYSDLPDTAHLFDVTFKNGEMEVHRFFVDDRTETFFRNLIASEQHSKDITSKYFTDYADFMNKLINSEKDVQLLRGKEIIDHNLADHKEVSNIFNKLCDGVFVRHPTSYHDVFRKVNHHYNKPLNRLRAALVRAPNYFDTPFATASTIAAIVLLVLTLLQTIAAYMYK